MQQAEKMRHRKTKQRTTMFSDYNGWRTKHNTRHETRRMRHYTRDNMCFTFITRDTTRCDWHDKWFMTDQTGMQEEEIVGRRFLNVTLFHRFTNNIKMKKLYTIISNAIKLHQVYKIIEIERRWVRNLKKAARKYCKIKRQGSEPPRRTGGGGARTARRT